MTPTDYKMRLMTSAHRYIGKGFKVFLVGPDKKPLQRGGFKNATADLADIDRALLRHRDGMLAVRTGRESGLVVIDIDVDPEKGVDGRIWLAEAHRRGFPEAPTVRTPRGGTHIYLQHPGAEVYVASTAGQIAPGVDVRSDGGYVVAPESRSPKGEYEWIKALDDRPLPEVPDWLLQQIVQARFECNLVGIENLSDADHKEALREFDSAINRVRAARPGQRNHLLNINAFIVGKMIGAGVLSETQASAKLIEAGVAIGLPELEVRRTAASGLRSGARHPWRPRAVDGLLHHINRDHFFALEGKTGFVHREARDPLTNRTALELITPGAFRELLGNRTVLVETTNGPKPKPAGDVWLKWPNRRQYDRVVFAPGRELPANVYNLWQGFTVDASPGKLSKFLAFLLTIVCAGDKEAYEYLLCWMARAAQQPSKPGEVAIVLRGLKGTGKTFFTDHFGELFGEHYAQLSSSHHLVGHFNAHLEVAIVVFADEAFWAGDKQGEGTLKTLITGKTLRIERKGIDSKSVPNHIHLIMASNSDWVVPATGDERRYMVLDVSSDRRQDHAYFEAIEQEWQSGGREAFLHELLHRDLSTFNVRKAPMTAALADQKLLSLPPIDRWYLGKLMAGTNYFNDWDEWASTSNLHDDYVTWSKSEGARISSREAFGMRLTKLLPPRQDGASRRRQRFAEGGREWGYEFPSVEECRKHLESLLGWQPEWTDLSPLPARQTKF